LPDMRCGSLMYFLTHVLTTKVHMQPVDRAE